MKNLLLKGLIVTTSLIFLTSSASAMTCTTLTKSLTKGSEGSEVTLLQQFLLDGGYTKIKPSGFFGSGTVTAVKRFQIANGMPPVGSVGPLTRAKVKEVSCGNNNIVSTDSFACGVSTVSDADGNVYNTVAIGSQCWMKQNIRVGKRIDVSTAQMDNKIIEKYCYSDKDTSCTDNHPNQPDGGLYQWNEAMQYSTKLGAQGICPTGWHIPTDTQFTTMERSICTSSTCSTDFPFDISTTYYRGTDEGTKLMSNGTSSLEVNLAGNSAFNLFYSKGLDGHVWSSSKSGTYAWVLMVRSVDSKVIHSPAGMLVGMSVRCLKD